jgi:pimeloyl-ACP methyl ester carboxylesterase
MSEPKTRQAKGDGLTIQLAEWPGAEKTILCIHGLSANCRWWDIVATALAPPPITSWPWISEVGASPISLQPAIPLLTTVGTFKRY